MLRNSHACLNLRFHLSFFICRKGTCRDSAAGSPLEGDVGPFFFKTRGKKSAFMLLNNDDVDIHFLQLHLVVSFIAVPKAAAGMAFIMRLYMRPNDCCSA